MAYYSTVITFVYDLVAPSPTYGVLGLPQNFFVLFRHALLTNVRFSQCLIVANVLLIFDNMMQGMGLAFVIGSKMSSIIGNTYIYIYIYVFLIIVHYSRGI